MSENHGVPPESATGADSAAGNDPLTRAAAAARLAPSVHNTQPWRWRISDGALELWADRSRQLRAIDPDGLMMLVSCGAALHHARVALGAQGYQAIVVRLPDGPDSDLLARITIGEHTTTDPAVMRLYQTTLVRQTDRRTVIDRPVDPAALLAVRRAAEAEDMDLQPLDPDQVIELAVAVSHAQESEAIDPAQREELARWVGGVRADHVGVPATVIPSDQPQTTVPEREFGQPGTLPPGEGHDTMAVYVVLHGAADGAEAWLHSGEVLNAIWLTAVEVGLSVLPFSAPVEVAGTRQVLRRMLADVGHPFMVVRLGTADDQLPGPPHTPRLTPEQIIDRTAG